MSETRRRQVLRTTGSGATTCVDCGTGTFSGVGYNACYFSCLPGTYHFGDGDSRLWIVSQANTSGRQQRPVRPLVSTVNQASTLMWKNTVCQLVGIAAEASTPGRQERPLVSPVYYFIMWMGTCCHLAQKCSPVKDTTSVTPAANRGHIIPTK